MAGFNIPGYNPIGGPSMGGTFESGGGGFSNTGTSSSNIAPGSLVSPTADPTFAAILKQALASMPQNLPTVEQTTSGAANSPLMAAILGPALQRLIQPQADARQGLTDITRAAGGLRDSGYGSNMTKLIGQQGLERNDLLSTVMSKVLAPLLSAQGQQNEQAYNPLKHLIDLLGQSRPVFAPGGSASSSKSGGSGWENIPPSQGLNTPMQSDKNTTSTETAAQAAARNAPSTYAPGYGGTATPSPIDPLQQYLLGGGGGQSNQIYQTGPYSWATAPTNPPNEITTTPDWSFASDPAGVAGEY